ncbi:hypothetical protein BU24DRAFT_463162 [Aaosphaeria arxii CBS 175.79]|uniref:Ecp2 effector protein domain-containing protein n=1 Tax=Aaosphaeria arxii CBS 175.79 TaxID=1450172 RepID=A0A6A5XN92_9PLEO|nr:uncharacterized protein BU24DRAFT_463162 [Aaosphaeria arxii CBS 175.79]KAF2014366.1 hypothetical protein BU24DRAFT_463162 [Aaosphaeria arxii CBS 175.79]
MFSLYHLISLAALSLAAPATRSSPQVIPGPGLPSLASLNLTSEYLYSLPKPVTDPDQLSTLTDPYCGPDFAYIPVNDAIACFHYLDGLGEQFCGVPDTQRSSVFCTAGRGSRIEGFGIGQRSWCKHVAQAVLWTIDHCTRPGQDTAGSAPAYGNGGLVVFTGK